MPLERIISGGQTGADQAGLFAAEELGLKTGGHMPKGFRTDEGPRPEFASRFGMLEDNSASYHSRTEKNVQRSDGTLIFGLLTGGSGLTVVLCQKFDKPNIIVPYPHPKLWSETNFKLCLQYLITSMEIKTLNVAGNRELINPGIFEACKTFLVEALKCP